jgi:hypothetical protein
MFCTEPGMKARYCMMPFIDEAKRLLRIDGRNYQEFALTWVCAGAFLFPSIASLKTQATSKRDIDTAKERFAQLMRDRK